MDDEVNLIFSRALESLKAAKLNLNNGFYNVSINRSYYATKALLFKKRISTKKHNSTVSNDLVQNLLLMKISIKNC
ncbi:MAG: HEPN domain-containing protein [Methanobrevibacter sp.]|nr:HEPN domain-containing protein [Candidatus Methanovirga aequatorialis]